MATLYRRFLGLALVLFSVHVGTAQEQLSKTVEERFPLTDAGTLQIENKYGNITVNGWDQNEVLVEITIMVNRRKRDDAQDLLRRINPDIKSDSERVSITSEVTKKNTGWFADFFNRTNPIDLDRSRVQINYEIYLPKKAKLKVTNRFGDVVLKDWIGELNTLIEHGDLWIGQDLGKADIILKFGKVRARSLNYASLNIKNGELDMENAKSLRVHGSGTEMQLGAINALELYSNKDEITVEEIGTIYGNLKFSSLKLERLSQEVDLSMKIADFRIQRVTGADAKISIEQESSDITIKVDQFSHHFEATLEQGVVRLPKSFENVDSKLLDKGSRLREIRATFGKSKSGLISINGVKGIVTINDK